MNIEKKFPELAPEALFEQKRASLGGFFHIYFSFFQKNAHFCKHLFAKIRFFGFFPVFVRLSN